MLANCYSGGVADSLGKIESSGISERHGKHVEREREKHDEPANRNSGRNAIGIRSETTLPRREVAGLHIVKVPENAADGAAEKQCGDENAENSEVATPANAP